MMLLNYLLGMRTQRPAWNCSIIFLRSGPFIDVVRDAGFNVAAVFDVRLRRPIVAIRVIRQLCRIIKALRPSVVFSWMAYGHLFGGLAATIKSVPAVWYQIASASGLVDRLATLLPVRVVLCVSHFIAARQDHLWPKRGLKVVWPGVDLTPYDKVCDEDRNLIRQRLNLPAGKPLAVIVGRMQRWKGMHTATAAMPQVLTRIPDARLVIVGGVHEAEPAYRDQLVKMISDLGLGNQVILAGLQQNVAEWMAAADVVIHASLEEPFGIVAVEGMACGRPVISGDRGGVIEAVSRKEGLHVPFEDARKLAEAMIFLFEHKDMANQMGAAGRERARDFTQAHYAGEICQTLEQQSANAAR